MQSEEHVNQDHVDNDVAAALRALAEEDCGLEAPKHIEARLIHAFRRKQTQRRWRIGLGWSLAAAAAVIVLLVGVRGRRPEARQTQYAPPQFVATTPAPVEIVDPPVSAPSRRVHSVGRRPKAQPREIVTEFFPLLDVAPPFERGELLRVSVPMSTMRKVGLPVDENRLGDRVYADVLVGNEGLARAIRFVSYEQ